MYKVTKYPHGTFSWVDNTSTNAEAAKVFYMDLFGWGNFDVPMGPDMFYTMFQHEGEHAAGFAAMMPDMQAQGIPSHWTNYVSVDDVDAMVEPIKANGGTILFGPMDIFDSGRMLQFMDPTGAQLGLWQPKNHIGAASSIPSAPCAGMSCSRAMPRQPKLSIRPYWAGNFTATNITFTSAIAGATTAA